MVTKTVERSKKEVWNQIEDKHFGGCYWQQRSPSGRNLLEGLLHKASGTIMIVEKTYAARLPGDNSCKPWPELIGLQVYAPVDPGNNTWDGLDAALTAFGKS